MRKLIFNLVAQFLVLPMCFAGDFRKGNFGWGLDRIQALEPDFIYSAEDQNSWGYAETLSGHVELLDRKAEASYHFIDGIFIWGSYVILEKYENPQVWFDEFLSFESSLTNKYGTPDRSQMKNWKGTLKLYEDKVGELLDRAELMPYIAPAILKGLLTIVSIWNKPNVVVALEIRGNNDNSTSLWIYYLSFKYTNLMKEEYLKDL